MSDKKAELQARTRFFFSQDQDSHWYMVPDCLRKDWEAMTANDLDEDAADSFDAKFGDYRLSGGIGRITFENPKEEA
jgi:hypothetical protein